MNERDEKELLDKVDRLEHEVGELRDNQQDLRHRARSAVGFVKRVLRPSVTVAELRNVLLEAISHFHNIGVQRETKDKGEGEQ